MEENWISFSTGLADDGSWRVYMYHVGGQNVWDYGASIIATLDEKYASSTEANKKVDELYNQLDTAYEKRHPTSPPIYRDLLWLVDKENPDRKYHLITVNKDTSEIPLVGEPDNFTVTITAVSRDQYYYYGSGHTIVEAIVCAVQKALKNELRRAETKAALDKYGE